MSNGQVHLLDEPTILEAVMGFFSTLEARARQTGSLLCVGLDPHLPDLPRPDAFATGQALLAAHSGRRPGIRVLIERPPEELFQ